MKPMENELSGFLMYLALAGDHKAIEGVLRLIPRDQRLGLLASYAYFKGESFEYLRDDDTFKLLWVILDCGAFSATKAAPRLFLTNGMRGLAQFFATMPCRFVIEPDVISHDSKGSMLATVFRAARTHHHLRKEFDNFKGYFLRPLHGRDASEREEFFNEFKKRLPYRDPYVALGGLQLPSSLDEDDERKAQQRLHDDLERTFDFLVKKGIKGVHCLGLTGEDDIEFMMRQKEKFTWITCDSSSWNQRTVYGEISIFDANAEKNKLRRTKFQYGGKNPDADVVALLEKCECQACRSFQLEDWERDPDIGGSDSVQSLAYWGAKMQADGRSGSTASKIFNRKGALHEIFQYHQLVQVLEEDGGKVNA